MPKLLFFIKFVELKIIKMSHDHNHHQHNSQKNIATAFFLNAAFVVIEVVGGIITNSIAILSDAFHDLGDCLSLATAWFLQKKSLKPRDKHYSYGYKRFSLLGSIFLSGILSFTSVYILYKAIGRIASPEEVNAKGMVWIAIFGVIINGAAALKVKKGSSLNERSVYLHIMEDVLGWVGVLVVSIVMHFKDLPILDPILSIIISIWVLFNVYKNLRDVFKILLQAIPSDIDTDSLTNEILSLSDVTGVHDLHIWSLDGESHIMTIHVVTNRDSKIMLSKGKREGLKRRIISIASNHHINHTTIEIEEDGEECQSGCLE